jgi:hypothetical protein
MICLLGRDSSAEEVHSSPTVKFTLIGQSSLKRLHKLVLPKLDTKRILDGRLELNE